MLNIINIETIISELVNTNNSIVNFPKKNTFEFPLDYKNLVTQIKTTEISAECVLFDSVKSVNVSKEFSDLDYWNENFDAKKIKNYWFFGANGQGDSWILDKKNNILFYDHNNGEISNKNLVDLELTFHQWLQFAFLNKEYEEISLNSALTPELKNIYKSKLSELSVGFEKKYPFDL
ncbi:SMI1/KNR4 family protein [Cellulophaga sp. HaHaR_3_176]|uniref:hypothetical protein n=1 Tax=Cellulophaga sp. HaHaR_3_176 TaxID=1942464 RepID=UPI001C1FED50|nr:hypothetical protein [Cellulophaga sp. HaHaR_3_176]QWX82640.1 SMI1/KNR4 family protein [Cellulophaga sp. HaHaR_3_176]